MKAWNVLGMFAICIFCFLWYYIKKYYLSEKFYKRKRRNKVLKRGLENVWRTNDFHYCHLFSTIVDELPWFTVSIQLITCLLLLLAFLFMMILFPKDNRIMERYAISISLVKFKRKTMKISFFFHFIQ